MTAKCMIAAAALALAAPAMLAAQGSVYAAQAAGTVGERYDGYLGMSRSGGEPLRRQVATVNLKRRSLYSQLAARRGVSPEEVGVTAACQLLARVEVGEAYLLGDNVWRRRHAGESAPRPSYCGG